MHRSFVGNRVQNTCNKHKSLGLIKEKAVSDGTSSSYLQSRMWGSLRGRAAGSVGTEA